MIIPVAFISGRPRTMLTLTWGPVAMTNEVVLPSFVIGQMKLECDS